MKNYESLLSVYFFLSSSFVSSIAFSNSEKDQELRWAVKTATKDLGAIRNFSRGNKVCPAELNPDGSDTPPQEDASVSSKTTHSNSDGSQTIEWPMISLTAGGKAYPFEKDSNLDQVCQKFGFAKAAANPPLFSRGRFSMALSRHSYKLGDDNNLSLEKSSLTSKSLIESITCLPNAKKQELLRELANIDTVTKETLLENKDPNKKVIKLTNLKFMKDGKKYDVRSTFEKPEFDKLCKMYLGPDFATETKHFPGGSLDIVRATFAPDKLIKFGKDKMVKLDEKGHGQIDVATRAEKKVESLVCSKQLPQEEDEVADEDVQAEYNQMQAEMKAKMPPPVPVVRKAVGSRVPVLDPRPVDSPYTRPRRKRLPPLPTANPNAPVTSASTSTSVGESKVLAEPDVVEAELVPTGGPGSLPPQQRVLAPLDVVESAPEPIGRLSRPPPVPPTKSKSLQKGE